MPTLTMRDKKRLQVGLYRYLFKYNAVMALNQAKLCMLTVGPIEERKLMYVKLIIVDTN